jgi:hypothetical protein
LVYFNCIFITNTGTSSFVAAFQVTNIGSLWDDSLKVRHWFE